MKKYKFNYLLLFITIFIVQSCVTKPPQNPDNICLIFQEKKGWYKAAIRSEKRWKVPPYVLMSFVYQESSFKADAKPERDKLLGIIPWFRPSTAVGYSQALIKTWEDYKDETGNNRANRKNFDDSADFIGWYASKGYYQGFEKTDARSLYLAYHEGWGGYKDYKNNQKVIVLAKKVKNQSEKYKSQLQKCQKRLNKNKYIIF